MKSIFHFTIIVLAGALLGTFLGKVMGIWFPAGPVHSLFATEINAGLHPSTVDLGLMDLTFGCLFKFNFTSLMGIIIAALTYKILIK